MSSSLKRRLERKKKPSPPSSRCPGFPVGNMCKSPQTGILCSRQSTALLWNHMRMAADSHGPESCETALSWLADAALVGGASSAGEKRNSNVTGEDRPVSIKHHLPAFLVRGHSILKTSVYIFTVKGTYPVLMKYTVIVSWNITKYYLN